MIFRFHVNFPGCKNMATWTTSPRKTKLEFKILFSNMLFLFKMNNFHVPALSFSGNRNLKKNTPLKLNKSS